VHVLRPDGGYGGGLYNESGLIAFKKAGLHQDISSCESLEGWTGSSGNSSWKEQQVSLAGFPGRFVRFEFLFSSDQAVEADGFQVSDIRVSVDRTMLDVNGMTPGVTLFDGEVDGKAMEQIDYSSTQHGGEVGKYDGVPVIGELPAGYTFDKKLKKVDETRSAPWSAKWDASSEPEASLRRAYLGWMYNAPIEHVKTAVLHPGQEACMRLQAPFRGEIRTATLFTLVDKMGVASLTLAMRSTASPHALQGAPMTSLSPGVADPGIHRFDMRGKGEILEKDDSFLMCVGIGQVRTLPADGAGSEPFLHLPLSEVSSASDDEAPGTTFLLSVPDLQRSEHDPWKGHTFVLRIEFMGSAEVPALYP